MTDCFQLSSIMPNIPRATSGTITGMIADFNKAMEALGTASPTEEQFQISSRLKHLERESKDQCQRAQNQQTVQNQNQKQTNASNHKNQTSMVKPQLTDASAAQPIIVMTSGPNQSTIPLQLQLNPQAVMTGQALLPSPQVEQQLQQQQILIQQQQQFLQIQIEQQKLQKQMTEQLSLRQKDDLEKQKEEKLKGQKVKEQVAAQTSPPKPEVIKKDKQVSTSTPPSVTSTPTSTPNKQMVSSSSTTTKASEASVNTSGANGRKSLHRRLPHPTTEEMQSAIQMAAHNVARTSAPANTTSVLASQRPISPLMPRKTQQSVISSQVCIANLALIHFVRHCGNHC